MAMSPQNRKLVIGISITLVVFGIIGAIVGVIYNTIKRSAIGQAIGGINKIGKLGVKAATGVASVPLKAVSGASEVLTSKNTGRTIGRGFKRMVGGKKKRRKNRMELFAGEEDDSDFDASEALESNFEMQHESTYEDDMLQEQEVPPDVDSISPASALEANFEMQRGA